MPVNLKMKLNKEISNNFELDCHNIFHIVFNSNPNCVEPIEVAWIEFGKDFKSFMYPQIMVLAVTNVSESEINA